MLENVNLTSHRGNIALIDYPHTGFLCSRVVPALNMNEIVQWAQGFTDTSRCIVCGCQTSIEYQVLQALLNNRVPVIVVYSIAVPEQIAPEWELALQEERMLILSQCDSTTPTNNAYQDRNALIIALSDNIVVGYCTRGGNIAQQMFGRPNVCYLSSYEQYDQQDHSLWSKSLHLSDGGTLMISLKTLNQQLSYVELTKAYHSSSKNHTEYATIRIPQDEMDELTSLLSEAQMFQRSSKSSNKYSPRTLSSPSMAVEEPMPWDEDLQSTIVRLSKEGMPNEMIAINTGAPLSFVNATLNK
ncbi:MAG: hypothetical protein MJZ27_06865 [Bacteroidales bacterium]|nr:hypothetical protein [Bacteroidales bacterium]